MACVPLVLDGKVVGFACYRGQRAPQCSICHERPATLLCDQPLRGKAQGRTCSAKLCARCVHAVRPELDLCPAHAKARRGWLAAMRAELATP